MFATLITEDNKPEFLGNIPENHRNTCNFFIGAVDEESDTACGVMACELFEGGILIIRHIFVNEHYRDMGAGRAMIDLFFIVARDAGVVSVYANVTSLYEQDDEADMDAIRVLLYSCGFEEESLGKIYSMQLSDAKHPKAHKGPMVFPLSTIEEKQWDKLKELNPYAEDRDQYSEDFSVLSFNSKKDCDGAVLVKEIGEVPLIDRIITGNEETVIKELLIDCAVDEMKLKLKDEDKVYVFIADWEQEKVFDEYCDGQMKLEGEMYLEYIDIM